jgi:hypothetical protein
MNSRYASYPSTIHSCPFQSLGHGTAVRHRFFLSRTKCARAPSQRFEFFLCGLSKSVKCPKSEKPGNRPTLREVLQIAGAGGETSFAAALYKLTSLHSLSTRKICGGASTRSSCKIEDQKAE